MGFDEFGVRQMNSKEGLGEEIDLISMKKQGKGL